MAPTVPPALARIRRFAAVAVTAAALSLGVATGSAHAEAPPSTETHDFRSAAGSGSTASTGSSGTTTRPSGSPQKAIDSVPILGTGTTSGQCDLLFHDYNRAVDNYTNAVNNSQPWLENYWGAEAARLGNLLSKHCIVIYSAE